GGMARRRGGVGTGREGWMLVTRGAAAPRSVTVCSAGAARWGAGAGVTGAGCGRCGAAAWSGTGAGGAGAAVVMLPLVAAPGLAGRESCTTAEHSASTLLR